MHVTCSWLSIYIIWTYFGLCILFFSIWTALCIFIFFSYLSSFFYAEKSLLMIAELPFPDTLFGQLFQMANYFFGAFFLSIFLGQVVFLVCLIFVTFLSFILFWCLTISSFSLQIWPPPPKRIFPPTIWTLFPSPVITLDPVPGWSTTHNQMT